MRKPITASFTDKLSCKLSPKDTHKGPQDVTEVNLPKRDLYNVNFFTLHKERESRLSKSLFLKWIIPGFSGYYKVSTDKTCYTQTSCTIICKKTSDPDVLIISEEARSSILPRRY